MRVQNIFLFLLICSFTFSSCKKEKVKKPEGLFKGTYTYTRDFGNPGQEIKTGKIELYLGDKRYAITPEKELTPPEGSGNYQFAENLIYFYDDRPRTSDFDVSLLVQDDFIMSFDGDQLYLVQRSSRWGSDRKYEFLLIKQ